MGQSRPSIMFKLKHFVLPALALAFTGVGVTFLQPVLTLKVRWAVLGLCFLYAIRLRVLSLPLKHRFGQLTAVFAGWCALTSLWSESPTLSIMKAGAFCMVAWTGMALGEHWVRSHTLRECVSFLYPLTAVTFVVAILGQFSTSAVVYSGPTVLYQGMVDGPNMFGAMIAMCVPFLALQVAANWHRIQRRWLWMAVSLTFLYYLLASASRGAFVVVVFVIAGLYVSVRARSRGQLTVLAGICVLVFSIGLTEFPERVKNFLYKNATTEQGLFHTRETVWEVSWEQARKGGAIGGGYGVTIGHQSEFAGGFTAIGYGREKGNSQFAIIEETGWIGFGIYLLGIACLIHMLVMRFRSTSIGAAKLSIGIATGLLVGMLVQSVFEAWWVAPGSAEAMYFWIMVGVATGLANDRRTSVARNTSQHELDTRRRTPVNLANQAAL